MLKKFVAALAAVTLTLAAIPAVDAYVISPLKVAHGGTGARTLDGAGIVTKSGSQVVTGTKQINDINVGASGTAGAFDIFPATAAKGKLTVAAANSAGDTTTTITNASQAGARTYTIPDAGGSTASFLLTTGTATATTAKTAELSLLSDVVSAITTTATPATGSCGVQFTFQNVAAADVASARTMLCYVSTSAGAQASAVDGLAVLTNGQLTELVTGKTALVTTDADGDLGITLTEADAGTYYISFVLPNGKIATSTALVVN